MQSNSLGSVLVLGLGIFVALALVSGGGCYDSSAREGVTQAMRVAQEAKEAAEQAQKTADKALDLAQTGVKSGFGGQVLGCVNLAGNILIFIYLYRESKRRSL